MSLLVLFLFTDQAHVRRSHKTTMRYGLKPHHGSDSETIHYLSGGKNSFKVKVWKTAMSSKSLHIWWWFYDHYDFLLKQASLKYCYHKQFHLNRILSKACMFPNFQKHNLVFNRCASSLPLSITEVHQFIFMEIVTHYVWTTNSPWFCPTAVCTHPTCIYGLAESISAWNSLNRNYCWPA